ncbi:sortase (surface protein transpeptidase) [Beggiatoa alba B18LD]|uniref:Sortase (Surface protein transpeptidase) n=1 Tax=Beggiatoa alba B18LD TaxID=395493 RepID=I3CJP6_9GAMM|nr:sortase [Beggiatoa alba]EIJ43839.1 sortase (surface protein transpeptidase) [Beggiatoa alba B18LD]
MRIYLGWGSTLIGLLVGFSVWQVSQQYMTYPQAWLTQGLMQTAWARTQASGRYVKPWPWAETWPLARLSIPQLNFEQIVLAKASNDTLALGHLSSTVLPGEAGNSVISVYHRNYARYMQALKNSDELVLEAPQNGQWRYRVSAIYVVDKTDTRFLAPSMHRRLTIISCYACSNGQDNLRHVVVADEIEKRMTASAF